MMNELLKNEHKICLNEMKSDKLDELLWYVTRSFLDTTALENFSVELTDSNLQELRVGAFKRIRFRKPSDINRGIIAFLDTINLFNLPFLFAVNAYKGEYQILFGLWEVAHTEESSLTDCFETVFDAIKGFFPGCEAERFQRAISNAAENTSNVSVENTEGLPKTKDSWWHFLRRFTHRRTITGIPSDKQSVETKNRNEQTDVGLEELADAAPDTFALVVFAEPLAQTLRREIVAQTAHAHDLIHQYAKVSSQQSETLQASATDNWNSSQSQQEGVSEGISSGTSQTHQPNMFSRLAQGAKAFTTGGAGPQRQVSSQKTHQETSSQTDTESIGASTTWGTNSTRAMTVEKTNKKAAHLEDLLNLLHKRLTSGNGLWHCFTEIYASSATSADKIGHLLCGMLSGEESRLDPMRSLVLPPTVTHLNHNKIFVCAEHPLGKAFAGLSSVLTTKELAKITRLPLHDIPGIEVEKLADYGRNWKSTPDSTRSIFLGTLVDRENETSKHIEISIDQLQRHCFVSGATGSGKSNTMRLLTSQLWRRCKVPFLVIEPIKREYRELQSTLGNELQVYALGDNASTFSLNPFDFDTTIGLIPHIDLLKAAFNASLGLYSSMPFILEHIIYKAYEQRGWNLETGENLQLNKIAAQLGLTPQDTIKSLFLPRMSDLPDLVDEAITNYFPSSTDYSGSLTGALKARLSSLTKGAKGSLLNRQQSMPLDALLATPCILELWPFADNEEKSFVMALILMRLYEYRQALELRHGASDTNALKHLLVIEEAHRLLTKPISGGDYTAQGKQKGVEVFADILAEIRSYGQGIVIVDQIPSKLIPDVLRNTDLKIAHRLVDKEDRQVLGATMNLDDDHIKDLARFSPGQATIYYSGLRKALRIKMTEFALPALGERQYYNTAKEQSEWREAALFGTFPQIGSGPLPARTVCARWAICTLIQAILNPTYIFEQNIDTILTQLPDIVGCTNSFAAQGGVMRSLPLIDEWLKEAHEVPYYTTIALICDAATLIKACFSRTSTKDILLKFKEDNLKLTMLQLAESRRSPDLLHILIGLHLNEPRIRTNFQNTIGQALRHYLDNAAFTDMQRTLKSLAQGCVLGAPLTERASQELMLRLLLNYHTDDKDEAEQLGHVFSTLKQDYTLIRGDDHDTE